MVIFIVLIVFILLEQKANLNLMKKYVKVCENEIFCNLAMPFEDSKILEFNRYQKSGKAKYIIYADLGCLI